MEGGLVISFFDAGLLQAQFEALNICLFSGWTNGHCLIMIPDTKKIESLFDEPVFC